MTHGKIEECGSSDLQLLYLDYDGCLHPDDVQFDQQDDARIRGPLGHELFECSPQLEQALRPHPDVRIILSTNWVLKHGLTRAAGYLRPALRERVIGATYEPGMNAFAFDAAPRWMQILNDVDLRSPRAWLALDDDAQGWPPRYADNLVRTHHIQGLSCRSVFAELVLALRHKFTSQS